MTFSMYSIKDELNGFMPPIPLGNDEVAKRYLREMLIDNNTMSKSPNDFSIWYLFDWDTETGAINTERQIALIERG